MYDIFYASRGEIIDLKWNSFKTKYPTAQKVENVKSFDQIKALSFTKLFWIIWDEFAINESFDLTEYSATKWDDMYIHMFRAGNYFPGICLFPRSSKISQEEFDNFQFSNIKLVDISASTLLPFNTYANLTYSEYLNICRNSAGSMFWIIWNDVEILDNSIFTDYFNVESACNRFSNHVFKSLHGSVELHTTDVVLFSKTKIISEREYNHKFLLDAEYHDKLLSKAKPYDRVFISYNEPNAEENFIAILSKFPGTLRVDKVTGIHNAHIEAAKLCDTDMFWVIDGDAQLVDNFDFSYVPALHETDIVHVWESVNPINQLTYGYGGVKLLPRKLTLSMDVNSTDMTTSISSKFKAMPVLSNVTAFNTDPYSTWRSAFRECVKLSSKIINGQVSAETEHRLNTWCTTGEDTVYGKYAIAGAISGKHFGELHKNNSDMLKKINDFKWLHDQWMIQNLQ